MPSFKKYLFLIFWVFTCQILPAQKNAEYYLEKSILKGAVEFQFTYYKSIQVDFNQYIQYNHLDDSLEIMLAQGKIYTRANGEKIFLAISEVDDMQCSFFTFGLFEIDEKIDSLIQIPFHSLIPQFSIGEFIDTVKIKKEIYPKYAKELSEYLNLGDQEASLQFLEELYDITYKISPVDNKLTATLHYCDYMPVNIIGFSPDDEKFLNTFKTIEMEFDSEKGVFLKK